MKTAKATSLEIKVSLNVEKLVLYLLLFVLALLGL
jgi:hypothetical protein